MKLIPWEYVGSPHPCQFNSLAISWLKKFCKRGYFDVPDTFYRQYVKYLADLDDTSLIRFIRELNSLALVCHKFPESFWSTFNIWGYSEAWDGHKRWLQFGERSTFVTHLHKVYQLLMIRKVHKIGFHKFIESSMGRKLEKLAGEIGNLTCRYSEDD